METSIKGPTNVGPFSLFRSSEVAPRTAGHSFVWVVRRSAYCVRKYFVQQGGGARTSSPLRHTGTHPLFGVYPSEDTVAFGHRNSSLQGVNRCIVHSFSSRRSPPSRWRAA